MRELVPHIVLEGPPEQQQVLREFDIHIYEQPGLYAETATALADNTLEEKPTPERAAVATEISKVLKVTGGGRELFPDEETFVRIENSEAYQKRLREMQRASGDKAKELRKQLATYRVALYAGHVATFLQTAPPEENSAA